MDKNYYKILEVDRNASPEIIEKAYKTLAKKYHPDLQDDMHKLEAEEALKKINEAYETLSNAEKKLLYDNTLDNDEISKEDFETLYAQNQILKNELNNMKYNSIQDSDTNTDSFISNNLKNNSNKSQYENSNYNKNTLNQKQAELDYYKQIQMAKEKAYYDAYIQDLKNRGYKIRYKKTFKDYIRIIITFIVVIITFYILWHIPFINNFFVNLYENNTILHNMFDLFSNLFNK